MRTADTPASPTVPDDRVGEVINALAREVPGIAATPTLARVLLACSPALSPAVADALDTGLAPHDLIAAVAALGPVGNAHNPVGAVVARVRRIAESARAVMGAEAEDDRHRAVGLGRRLATLVRAGTLALDATEHELTSDGLSPELLAMALDHLHEGVRTRRRERPRLAPTLRVPHTTTTPSGPSSVPVSPRPPPSPRPGR